MKSLRDPLLLLTVFVSGATVMSTEMGATRLLAPYFGTSQLIWANLIGLILIYLTVGYALGGRLADRNPYRTGLYKLTAWAGFAIVLIPILAQPLLNWSAEGFARFSTGIFFGSLFSIILLFAAPLTLLGAVSPYAIRLRVQSVDEAGNAAGSLYALSTVGSIVGTFLPVLWLQPTIGTRKSVWLFGLVLLVISLAGLLQQLGRRAVVVYGTMLVLAVLLVAVFEGGGIRKAEAGQLLFEDESQYNYIQVVNNQGQNQLILNEGHAVHSVYDPRRVLSGGGPWDYFLLAPLFRQDGSRPVSRLLVVGLAGGTVAKQYAAVYPRAQIDGVEIDGEIVDVGRKYFDMNEPQLHVYVNDGRYFLLRTQARYDVIGVDAYRQPYIPFHLATVEFFRLVRDRLTPDGVAVINTGRTPGDRRLVDAMGSTMAAVFPSVFTIDTASYSNTLVYASKRPMTLDQFYANAMRASDPNVRQVLQWAAQTGHIQQFQANRQAFTDDLAPIEQVIDQIIVRYAVAEAR